MIIRNQPAADDDSSSNAHLRQQVLSRGNRRKTNKMPKLTVLAAYGGVFICIVSLITAGYQPPRPLSDSSAVASASVTQTPSLGPVASSDIPETPSVDEIVATDVAAKLAEQTNMAVAANVANLSVSLAAKSELGQTSDVAIVKPQIIQSAATSRDVTTYTAKQGDTVQSVAATYGLNPDTIRWANNLTVDSLTAGKVVTIAPTDGVVYTVKTGDTADSLASTYSASKDRIISFNDLEISGLTPGTRIVIPNGVLPEAMRPGYVAPVSRATTYGYATGTDNLTTVSSNFHSTSGNGYAYGYCTWYAFERRLQLGRPIGGNWGNASTWAAYARASGFRVDNTPEVGAILQNGGGAGHVAIVEQVMSDGTIVLSEMNYAGGWGRVTKGRTITPGQYASSYYKFIH